MMAFWIVDCAIARADSSNTSDSTGGPSLVNQLNIFFLLDILAKIPDTNPEPAQSHDLLVLFFHVSP